MAYRESSSCSVLRRAAAFSESLGIAAVSLVASVLTGGSKRRDMPGIMRRLVHVLASVALLSLALMFVEATSASAGGTWSSPSDIDGHTYINFGVVPEHHLLCRRRRERQRPHLQRVLVVVALGHRRK